MSKISLQFLVIILLLLILCTTRIQKLTVENDNCNNHFLLDFGFQEGGIFKIQVDYVLLDPPPNQMKTLLPIGFIADSTSGISEEDPSCSLLLQPNNESIFSIRKTQEDWKRGFTFQTVMNETKLYSIWYSNCYQDLPLSTYEITLNLKNPNSYLSAGEIPLPTIYILFFVIYLLLFVSWQMFLKKKAGKKYKIHSLMTVLLIAKSLSIFSKSVEYYLISSTGKSKGADIAYYIFHL
ncbi:hypothetical protein M0813_29930 [Anaeramoeba flamelloides]|uniref:Intimal thickness related receptor IRP domain-containing protein n=1 Tax=Anaeramoeba flamelloides TaxID=1746091 RepID=A0ABQ8XLV7_9EUKA|nr:hypothetical protein M0813_29930 [Anaeramoeba flamelloides]